MKVKILFRLLVVALLSTVSIAIKAQVNKDYFIVENYYKVKWGFADEFINLWKANHYPLLKKAIEKGDIISVDAEKPRLHSWEDTR